MNHPTWVSTFVKVQLLAQDRASVLDLCDVVVAADDVDGDSLNDEPAEDDVAQVVDHRQGLRHDVDGVTKICDFVVGDDCDDVVGSAAADWRTHESCHGDDDADAERTNLFYETCNCKWGYLSSKLFLSVVLVQILLNCQFHASSCFQLIENGDLLLNVDMLIEIWKQIFYENKQE